MLVVLLPVPTWFAEGPIVIRLSRYTVVPGMPVVDVPPTMSVNARGGLMLPRVGGPLPVSLITALAVGRVTPHDELLDLMILPAGQPPVRQRPCGIAQVPVPRPVQQASGTPAAVQ